MWHTSYEDRLRSWHDLKEKVLPLPLKDQLDAIVSWWSHAPIVNNIVHWDDKSNWPGPWELLAENGYCELASSLGLSYTVLQVNNNVDVKIAVAKDSLGSEVTIVLIDNGKYILNWDHNDVLSTDEYKFEIIKTFDCDKLKTKIG